MRSNLIGVDIIRGMSEFSCMLHPDHNSEALAVFMEENEDDEVNMIVMERRLLPRATLKGDFPTGSSPANRT